MALYINKERNSLKIRYDTESKKWNFLLDLVPALKELNPNKDIKIIVDMERTPLPLVLYLRKVQQQSNTTFTIYNRDESENLRNGLEGFGFKYYKIKEFK